MDGLHEGPQYQNQVRRRPMSGDRARGEDDHPYSAARLADRAAIADTLHRVCRAVDRLDYDAIRACYHPDAHDNHGPYVGDVEGFVAWIRARHQNIAFSMHQISNILIEFAGPDLALVETYVWCVQRYPPHAKAALAQLSGGKEGKDGVGIDLFSGSRYVDRFERRGGEWRILRRTLIMDWKTMLEVPENVPAPLPTWPIGRRDSNDILYQERAALGIKP